MSADDKKIAELYNSRFDPSQPNHKNVGWGTEESQNLRFQILTEIGDLNGSRILDVGCGLGDLYFFLETRGVKDFEYTGVDLSSSLLQQTKKRLDGRKNANINLLESGEKPYGNQYDFVLSSGALSYRVADNRARAERILENMFHAAAKGVACNFLSSYVDFTHEKNFHYKPEEIFSFSVKRLTRKVVLRHDYPLYEFTAYLYR